MSTVRAARTTARDLAAWPQPLPVRAWMTTPVVTIRADAPARDAVGVLKTRKVRHLPVVDEHDRLVGIVTDRDLRQLVFDVAIQERLTREPDALADVRVRDVMTWSVVSVRPDVDIRVAARLMHEQKIGALPVVADGKVLGMLTEHDVLAAFSALVSPRIRRAQPLRGAERGGVYDYGFPVAEPRGEEGGTGGGP